MLAGLTRHMDFWGNIASVGLAGGAELKTTVMPFILRGVNLLGINSSATPRAERLEVWQRIATRSDAAASRAHRQRTIAFAELPGAFQAYIDGKVIGRTVVKIGCAAVNCAATMSHSTPAPLSAGAKFRAALAAEKPLQVVGAINAYAARMAEATGFRALYLSGGGVAANSLGLPDLGISTMDDVLIDIRRITEASTLPLLVDADTGWGGAFNIARTVRSFTKAGAAGMHIEDQVQAKRCGHRPGKEVVPARGDGRSRQGRGGRAHRCQLHHHGAQRRAGERGPRAQ